MSPLGLCGSAEPTPNLDLSCCRWPDASDKLRLRVSGVFRPEQTEYESSVSNMLDCFNAKTCVTACSHGLVPPRSVASTAPGQSSLLDLPAKRTGPRHACLTRRHCRNRHSQLDTQCTHTQRPHADGATTHSSILSCLRRCHDSMLFKSIIP